MKRPSLTIGIEEEYQVVDPESGELRSFITQFIKDGKMVMVEREIKPELHQSMVEMGTPVCDTPAQAKELERLTGEVTGELRAIAEEAARTQEGAGGAPSR